MSVRLWNSVMVWNICGFRLMSGCTSETTPICTHGYNRTLIWSHVIDQMTSLLMSLTELWRSFHCTVSSHQSVCLQPLSIRVSRDMLLLLLMMMMMTCGWVSGWEHEREVDVECNVPGLRTPLDEFVCTRWTTVSLSLWTTSHTHYYYTSNGSTH